MPALLGRLLAGLDLLFELVLLLSEHLGQLGPPRVQPALGLTSQGLRPLPNEALLDFGVCLLLPSRYALRAQVGLQRPLLLGLSRLFGPRTRLGEYVRVHDALRALGEHDTTP